MFHRRTAITAGLLVTFILGCSSQEIGQQKSNSPPHRAQEASPRIPEFAGMGGMGPDADIDSEAAEIREASATLASDSRRIIFDTTVDLKVDSFTGIERKVSKLVAQHGGFVSSADISQRNTAGRFGSWTIRVPVESYRKLLDSFDEHGTLISRNEKASDVTREFYDLESRIKNKKLLEERIAKLLDNAKSELRKMIEVERELARVREEIERMQGELRFLADVTSLSTIHLNIHEQEKPPAPVVAQTFASRIADAWKTAATQAQGTLENIAVVFVRNVFAILLSFVSLCLTWMVVRIVVWRVTRQRSEATAVSG